MNYLCGQFNTYSWSRKGPEMTAVAVRDFTGAICHVNTFWGGAWFVWPVWDSDDVSQVRATVYSAVESCGWSGNPPSLASEMLRYTHHSDVEEYYAETRREYLWMLKFWTAVNRRFEKRYGLSLNDGADRDWWAPKETYYPDDPEDCASSYVADRGWDIDDLPEDFE